MKTNEYKFDFCTKLIYAKLIYRVTCVYFGLFHFLFFLFSAAAAAALLLLFYSTNTSNIFFFLDRAVGALTQESVRLFHLQPPHTIRIR